MATYSYIHIALRGEAEGSTRTLCSYPSAAEGVAWEKMLVTPGAAVKRFLNVNECYIMQDTPSGHCFSFITRNAAKGNDGYEMISVFVDNGCALTGKQLLALFPLLKKSMIDDGKCDDEAISKALAEAGVPEEPVRLSSWNHQAASTEVHREEGAYRTYISTSDLATIFSFPTQPDYRPYRCIIVVPATASLRPGVKMPRITSPIRKQYTVVAPEGVSLSADSGFDGDRIIVTFTKPGFDPHTETITLGNPSAYARIDGSTVKIKAHKECGFRFVRRIAVTVKSAKGTPLNGYTISINDRSVNTMEPFVEFTEKELTENEAVEIKVASNNYIPIKLKKATQEILATDSLDFELQPVEQGVTLRLDFGDGRVIEQYILIEKNTSEYNRLHSGNFHGFRAHRLVTQDHSEVYNVDVRFDGRPVAPNFETSKPTEEASNSSHHAAPVFENISDKAGSDREAIDTAVPTLPDETPQEEEEDAVEEIKSSKKRTTWILAAAGAIIALIVVLVLVLPSGEKLDVKPTAEIVADDAATAPAATDQAAPAANAQAPAATPNSPEFAADVEYLNSTSKWDVTRLKSAQGKQLIEAIKAGDIDSVVNNDYFALAGKCTNAKAIETVGLIWRANGSPTTRRITGELKKAVDGNTIDLIKLADRLARFQPQDADANTSPRPTH